MKNLLKLLVVSLSIIFVVIIVVLSFLTNRALTPNVSSTENTESSNDFEQTYRVQDVTISMQSASDFSLKFDTEKELFDLVFPIPKDIKHFASTHSLTFFNYDDKTHQIIFSLHQADTLPTGTEIAITLDNTSYILLDAQGNIYPAELDIAPYKQIQIGIRFDSMEKINYQNDTTVQFFIK